MSYWQAYVKVIMYKYACAHVHIYPHAHVCAHTHVCTYTCMRSHKCMPMLMQMLAGAHAHTQM